MAAKKIQSKYFIYGFIPNSSYTFTGADRQASFGVSGDLEEFRMFAISTPDNNSKIVFPVENKILIRRARITGNGAPGLHAGVNHIAAKINLEFGTFVDEVWKTYDSKFLHIPNWEEWAEINLNITPFRRMVGDSSAEYVLTAINPEKTIFYLDDYNLQEDFVGQGVTPLLELGIETAGLVCQTNGRVF